MMTVMADTPAKPRRRSFSLRTLFVMVTVIGTILAVARTHPEALVFAALLVLLSGGGANQMALPPWLLRRH